VKLRQFNNDYHLCRLLASHLFTYNKLARPSDAGLAATVEGLSYNDRRQG